MSAHFTFQAIGTSWVIDIPEDVTNESELLASMQERIEEFDKTYSRFRSDSTVSKIAQSAGVYALPDDAEPMFSLYRELYEMSEGLVTPLVGQVLVDVGYDTKYSLHPKSEIRKIKKWDDVMKYSYPTLGVKEPIQLDFGAVGKGYLIDLVGEVLSKSGIENYIINAGGDIAYKNTHNKNLRVGLENPENSKEVLGVAEIINKSICGSAGNRRAWGKYRHIINPNTAESPKHILGLWVAADSTRLADGLTTALFFMEPERLKEKYDFEYAIVYADRTFRVSEKFPGTFFN